MNKQMCMLFRISMIFDRLQSLFSQFTGLKAIKLEAQAMASYSHNLQQISISQLKEYIQIINSFTILNFTELNGTIYRKVGIILACIFIIGALSDGFSNESDYFNMPFVYINIQLIDSLLGSCMENRLSFEKQIVLAKTIISNDDKTGMTQQEINDKIKKRLAKFYRGQDYLRVDIQHYHPRIQPYYDKGIQTSQDTIILFGIDFLKRQELKHKFSRFGPNIHIIDKSNCIITFPTPEFAYYALRANAKPDSQTHYKIEQGLQNQEVNKILQNEKPKCKPRQWIQLTPYYYHFAKNKNDVREVQRKLYARYATTKQKEAGFNQLTFIDQLLQRCRAISETNARNNQTLKNLMEKKMQLLIQKKKQIQRSQDNRSKRSQNREMERDRSRQKRISSSSLNSEDKNKSLCFHYTQLHNEADSDKQSNFSNLMSQMQDLNLNARDEDGDSIIATKQIFNKKSKPKVDIPYRVMQPGQVKQVIKGDNFDYTNYFQQELKKRDMEIKVGYIDLTEIE